MSEKNESTEGRTYSESRGISFGFSFSAAAGKEAYERKYREALREHIARMQQKLDELEGTGLSDGAGI